MIRNIGFAAACFANAVALVAKQEQMPLGSIATRDAMVSGALQVQGEQVQLLTTASVTAYNRIAAIELTRGGDILVCSTSRFHIQRSGNESSLVFALDRGAIEIHSDSQPQDVVITPDLRMTFATSGRLDLRLRVTSNGDTCVENTGKSAPQIAVSDAFSDSSYHLQPGQHVLFEHGSVREVVDQEQSPCGCPAEPLPVMNIAQNGSGSAVEEAAARNPFPAAVSQGLAPETKPVTPAPADAKNDPLQSTSALSYSEAPVAVEKPSPPPMQNSASPQPAALTPPPSPPGAHDIVHAIGRFFHRLFHGDPRGTSK